MVGGGVVWSLLSRSEDKGSSSVETHQTLIERLSALGRLELLRYEVRDVVRKEWHYVLPLSRSRLLLVVAGDATICIDFAQVRVEAAEWEQRRVRLVLPEPFVCQVRVDPAQSQVYDASFSVVEWWGGGEAERTREALAAAQETLRARIGREFPHQAAQAQAEKLLRTLCEEMGWKQVEIHHASHTGS